MAYQANLSFNAENFTAASVINAYAAVQISASSDYTVLPASSASAGAAVVYGLAIATSASVPQNVTVQTGGWGKALAGSSVGRGARVGVGIGTTSLVPLTPIGQMATTASGCPNFAIGISLSAAAAGEIFTVKIAPQEVI